MLILERVTAVLFLTHAVIAILTTFEQMRTAAILGTTWEQKVPFSAIAATLFSLAVIVRWIQA